MSGFRKISFLFLSLILITSCTNVLLPPGIPSGQRLEQYASKNFSQSNYVGKTARDSLVIGVAYVDEHCSTFFDAVERAKQSLVTAKSVFSTAANQTQNILKVAEASTLAVASVTGGVEVTKVFLEQFLNEFAFGQHSSAIKRIVNKAMSAQRKQYGRLISEGKVESQVEVIAAVKKYAENCTLATIREHWDAAINSAAGKAVVPDGTPTSDADLIAEVLSGTESANSVGASSQANNVLGVPKYVIRQ